MLAHMDDNQLTPDEARYAVPVIRAEQRDKEAEAAKYPAGHSSRAAFEYSATIYRNIAEKLERQAGLTTSASAPSGAPPSMPKPGGRGRRL